MTTYRLRKRKTGFLSCFKPNIEIKLSCRETLLSRLGIGKSYKSGIKAHESLVASGEADRISEIFFDQQSDFPLRINPEKLDQLQDYEIQFFGRWKPIDSDLIKTLKAIHSYMETYQKDKAYLEDERMLRFLGEELGREFISEYLQIGYEPE